MEKKKYSCEYCGKRMSKFDYVTYKGYCRKCRDLIDWKKILKDMKEK
ncbi:MAG: hypothetical protein V5A64_06145 [Candidatus Thermoplasmatota archaeon]